MAPIPLYHDTVSLDTYFGRTSKSTWGLHSLYYPDLDHSITLSNFRLMRPVSRKTGLFVSQLKLLQFHDSFPRPAFFGEMFTSYSY
jgi:hypothetical protein